MTRGDEASSATMLASQSGGLVEELAARVTVPIVAEGRITAHFVAGMRRDPSGFPT